MSPPELPSRWSVAAALLTGAAIALSLAAVAATDDGDARPVARVGQVFTSPFHEDPLPGEVTIDLPWARVDAAVGAPRARLRGVGDAPADVAPPSGGSFVPVSVSIAPARVDFLATGQPLQGSARLSLRTDGVDQPVDTRSGLQLGPYPTQPSGAIHWVAVAGHPRDVALVVDVDGQEQVITPDGRVDRGRSADLTEARSLERDPAQPRDCGRPRRGDDSDLEVDGPPGCTVKARFRTPYVDGIGWAPEGREYLSVSVAVDELVRATGDGRRWRTSHELTARLGGERALTGPTDINSLNTGTLALQDPDSPDLFVFEVPEGSDGDDLEVRMDLTASAVDPFDPDRERLTLTWTIPGGELP